MRKKKKSPLYFIFPHLNTLAAPKGVFCPRRGRLHAARDPEARAVFSLVGDPEYLHYRLSVPR